MSRHRIVPGLVSALALAAAGLLPSPATAQDDGGPDFWEVTGVPAGDVLNVRSAAGTGGEIVGALANGDRVRNLGCRMVGESRWCQIEAGTEMPFRGWVNGRYLREAGGAAPEATGRVPCATVAGQPMQPCAFRVSRGTGGTASVWVTMPDGKERYIAFKEGTPVTSEAGLDVTFQKNADLYVIRINDERYEIPEAVVFGG